MEFIKEEREDTRIEETLRVQHDDIRIEETFTVKPEDTEKQKVCSAVWHEYFLKQTLPQDKPDFSSDTDNESDEDNVLHSNSESDSDTSSVVGTSLLHSGNIEVFQSRTKTTDEATEDKAGVHGINYCYVCQKPQSKIARHLETHKTEAEVKEALSYPKRSVKRRLLLEKLRNRGNFQHNLGVLKNGTGQIKLKRTSKQSKFIHCVYCKGMFCRNELWRHSRRCHFVPEQASGECKKGKVLSLATTAQSVFCESISQGVWKLVDAIRQDDLRTLVRNDFGILQLAQILFNKHGADTTKHDYIRQKLRELARVLLVLRGDSIYTIEDAVMPGNFHKVVKAVKKVSGFDEESNSYAAPSLALKVGHSLQKIADIIHCRALMTENEGLVKSTDAFKSLYSTKWCELVSHSALNSLKNFNKPTTLPFTQDVQLLHAHLEKAAKVAFDQLKEEASPQSYADLAKATLAQAIVCNQRCAEEVSKMCLKNFFEREIGPLHVDESLGLTELEKKLCEHFSRVEIVGESGRKAAVLLTPDMEQSLNLLVSRRTQCGVQDTNIFLFARPKCLSYYCGQASLRLHAEKCGAKNPEHLCSTQLRRHIATLSQILNLKEGELDQVADFLGHDVRVLRDPYGLPEATAQLAKISKLLLAMDKGCLGGVQGKSLDEIQSEDEIPLTDTEDEADDEPAGSSIFDKQNEMSTSTLEPCLNGVTKSDEHRGTTSRKKRMWSKAEVAAVIRHFKAHIAKGQLATKSECLKCKSAEEHVLQNRSAQNIRDFVRNRGIAAKKSRYECVCTTKY